MFFGRGSDILEARETLEGFRRHNEDVPRLVLFLGSSGSSVLNGRAAPAALTLASSPSGWHFQIFIFRLAFNKLLENMKTIRY